LEAAREIAELKVTLLTRDITLERLLEEVATLLDLSWSRRGSPPSYRYECARSHAAVLRAQATLEQARAAHRVAVQAQAGRLLEALHAGDLDKLASTDPELARAMEDTFRGSSRRVLQSLAQTIAERIPELVQSSRLTISFDQMPQHVREAISREAAGVASLGLGDLRGAGGNSPAFEAFLRSASVTMGIKGLDYGENRYFAELSMPGFALRYEANPGSLGAPPAASPPTVATVSGAPAAGGIVAPTAGRIATPIAPRRLPAVSATLEGGKSMSVTEIADWLAEKAALAVVSDYYVTRYPHRRVPVPEQATAEALLAAMERSAQIDVRVAEEDRVIRLRSRRWVLDDLQEPPAAVVDALEASRKANGRLGFSDYLLIAQLTEPQQFGLANMDEPWFDELRHTLDGSRGLLRDVLRLTAALTPAQRAAAESSAGLPAGQLLGTQRLRFVEAVTHQLPELPAREAASAVFRIRHEAPAAAGGASAERYLFAIEFPRRPPLSTVLAFGG
jgi:hypothetical protein